MFTTAQVTTTVQLDKTSQRQSIGVVTIPDGQVIPSVDLPQNMTIEPPAVNSTVLVWVNGSFGAKFISKLVDPNNSSSRLNLKQLDGQPFMEPGELQIGVATGSHIFFNNTGGIHITSGNIKDEIVIDNQNIKIAASTIDMHATNLLPGIQSHVQLDPLKGATIGFWNPLTSLELFGISVDPLGTIKLSNPLGSISLSALGVATLESGPGSGTLVGGVGQVKVFPTGLINIKSATEVSVTAPVVSVDSASINLGTAGQKLATESFVKLLYDIHTHTSTTPGNPTSPPLVQSSFLPTATTTVTKAL